MYECVHALKEANPEFTHYFFDDDNCRDFIKTHFDSTILHAYDTLKPGAYKADLWRYCVLYLLGGIYIDIKYRCVAPFKLIELTTQEHFIQDREYGNNPGVYQAIMICYPKNPILLKCIGKIVEYVHQLEYGSTILFVGPLLVGSFFDRSEILTWDMKYTGLQIVRNNVPLLEMYSEYYTEANTSSIRTYYMESWCNRDIYSLPSLPSKKTHPLTRTIAYQGSHLFVHSPKWIDKETTRNLYGQWSSYLSREDGAFSGTREHRLSKSVTDTSSFSMDMNFYDPLITQWSMNETSTIHYVSNNEVFSGPDMDCVQSIVPAVDVQQHGMGSAITLDKPYFIYRWYPIVLIDEKLQVFKTSYHTPTFFKELTSSVPCVRWNEKYFTILTKCVHYELNGSPRKKYAHIFVLLDDSLNVMKYSEFFIVENSSVSTISDFHIQDHRFMLGITVSNGICMICEYEESDILGLRWN
jgi:hypothetical protein